jgi:acetoin utilization deacetylase AcuC-like enzyme
VLVVDWDVHHGNGTQEIFYDSERVWFFSAHRFPFYPGTGREEETGTGAGLGSTFNLPLPANTPSREYHARFSRMLEDALTRGQPDLIILSAGFDAHRADPIGGLNLETEDFARLTDLLVQAAESACRGRIVGLLEGGYNLQRLPESLRAHLERLQA